MGGQTKNPWAQNQPTNSWPRYHLAATAAAKTSKVTKIKFDGLFILLG